MSEGASPAPARSPVPPGVRAVAIAAFVWSLGYAAYRLYYALGGEAGLPGVLARGAGPAFRSINAFAAALLVAGAMAALAFPRLWNTRLRTACVVVAWLVAVGCVAHAVIDSTQRVLSLTGTFQVTYPSSLWASVDRPVADLQDLLGNEPWFLAEGILIASLCLLGLGRRGRRLFLTTGAAATAAAVILGVLAAAGVVPRVILG